MFDGGRRRSFDRQNNNDQNSTGYSEKTVFPTDFGGQENNNFQNGYAQPTTPQNNGYDGYAQNQTPAGGMYAQQAQHNYAYAQSSAPVTTAQMRELPMVFASRTHSDVYIYEYSDRLEYYLRTATSMYLFNTVRKQ